MLRQRSRGRAGASAADTAGAPARRRRRRTGSVVTLVAILLLLLAGVYTAGYFFTSDRVPRNVDVAGVSIGGLRPVAAEEKLEDELVPRSFDPIIATAGDQRFPISPRSAGLSLDVDATVNVAGGGRSLNPLRMLEVLTGGEDVRPVVTVDEDRLTARLQRLAEKVSREPVEGTVMFEGGQAQARYPLPGRELDVVRAGEALQAAYLSEDPEVVLPVSRIAPEVSEEAVRTAMESFAEPAVSAPVTIRVPGSRVRIPPRAIAPALSMELVEGQFEPRLNEDVLYSRIRSRLRPLEQRPVDATVALRNGRPEVVPGQPGTAVQKGMVADRVLPVLTETGQDRVIRLRAVTAQPDFTTREARRLGVDEVVSEFTTYYPDSDYRNVNQGRAAELINGTLLKPGDVFSFNDVVGERTRENGFTEGFVISDGVLVEDLGGGVSQVVTTTYNAAFFAGLRDIEHHPHSFYIDRYPMGREATVAWGALDLRFENDTPYGVLVQAWVVPSTPGSEGEMHVRMWSTKHLNIRAGRSEQYNFTEPDIRYDEGPQCVEQIGHGGFDVDVYRYFIRRGERVKTETYPVTYIAADTVYCRPAPN